MRALVVDDSKAMRMLLGRQLRQLGFEVGEAGDGLQALEVLRAESQWSVVLVDWNMPRMDGLSFVQEVRGEPDWAGIQLMMVTTETETDQVVRALEAGANEYLMKPFVGGALAEKLALLGVLAA